MSAGKGDDRRPCLVSDAEYERRHALAFGYDLVLKVVRCPKCGRDVTAYVRKHGEQWCPWCSIKL